MKCKICHSFNTQFYYQVGKWELQKCKNCGFVEVRNEPTSKELHDLYSILYFENNKYKNKKSLFKEYRYRLKFLSKHLPSNSTVLDFGCAGADFIHFAKEYFKFYGTDISKPVIRRAKKDFPYLKNSLFEIHELDKIPDKSLDAIIMWDVIEHLWNPQEVISMLLSKLHKNGLLFISTPKIDSRFAKTLKTYWPFMTPPEHLSFFSKAAFDEFSTQNSLEIVEIKNKGKWVNLAFMAYKIKRIAPNTVPNYIMKFLNLKYINRLYIYAPTGDIQYLALKRLNN